MRMDHWDLSCAFYRTNNLTYFENPIESGDSDGLLKIAK